jgi:hypothetical protein
MWCHVTLVETDVSEKSIPYIIEMKVIKYDVSTN